MYIENNTTELKECYTDNIVRDIVAFLNTDGGRIFIGVDDNGKTIGIPLKETDEIQKKVSDCIATQIEPNPQSEISISSIPYDEKCLIRVFIVKGVKPLYCIKKYGFSSKGCLERIGTTCREMSPSEIKHRYENNFLDDDYILKAPSHYCPLTFDIMKILLTSKGFHLNENTFGSSFSLKNTNGKYNLMAELLADKNMVSLIFVKFRGSTKASISERNDYGDQSILLGLQRLKDRLIAENICVTDTTVRPRIDQYLYDMDCVNEALVNAIVHNDWTISEPLVCFYEDRLEITSHGGIPNGISKDDFFNGVSHPRNSVLMRIFLKLGIVEHTGHGIPKIIQKYGKEAFDVHDRYINVVIPFNKQVLVVSPKKLVQTYDEQAGNDKVSNNDFNPQIKLTNIERLFVLQLTNNADASYDEIASNLGVSRSTISRLLASLKGKGCIKRVGTNKGGYWKILIDLKQNHIDHANDENDRINDENDRINNDGKISDFELSLLRTIRLNPGLNITDLLEKVKANYSFATQDMIQNALKRKLSGYVEHRGSKKTGGFYIKRKDN